MPLPHDPTLRSRPLNNAAKHKRRHTSRREVCAHAHGENLYNILKSASGASLPRSNVSTNSPQTIVPKARPQHVCHRCGLTFCAVCANMNFQLPLHVGCGSSTAAATAFRHNSCNAFHTLRWPHRRTGAAITMVAAPFVCLRHGRLVQRHVSVGCLRAGHACTAQCTPTAGGGAGAGAGSGASTKAVAARRPKRARTSDNSTPATRVATDVAATASVTTAWCCFDSSPTFYR